MWEKEENRGMSYRNFTPSQVLNRAIGKEEEARTIYELYAEKVEDAQAKKILSDLAMEELGHKRALEKIDPESPGVFEETEIAADEFGEFFERPQISKDSSLQEVLRFAIAEETDACNFYAVMKKYTKDETFLNLLNRLSGEEKKHQQKLERMYDEMFQPEN
jgi:rubrerythrin